LEKAIGKINLSKKKDYWGQKFASVEENYDMAALGYYRK